MCCLPFSYICSLQAIISLPFYCYYNFFFLSHTYQFHFSVNITTQFMCETIKTIRNSNKSKLYNLSKIKSTVTHIQYHMLFNCVFMLISHLRVVGVSISIKIINKHDQNEQTKSFLCYRVWLSANRTDYIS